MEKFEWIGYSIDDEPVCGGEIFGFDEHDANRKIELEIQNDYDGYAECGYAYHEVKLKK